jgi:hypothetical protein
MCQHVLAQAVGPQFRVFKYRTPNTGYRREI